MAVGRTLTGASADGEIRGGKLLESLVNNPDYEWLMIDASHIKVHPHASRARGENQAMNRTKDGAQHKITFGRGYAWYAGPNAYYGRCHGGLLSNC